jgi:hypothetical protein
MFRKNKSKGYAYHWHKAILEWQELNDKCAKKLEISYQDYDETEKMYITDHFEEMEQVKIIHDYKLGHCLKIKWENFSCWWADCNCIGFYYCVMLDIDNIDLETPASLDARGRKK